MTNTLITMPVTFNIRTRKGLVGYITQLTQDKEVLEAMDYYIQDDESASAFCELWDGEVETIGNTITLMMEDFIRYCNSIDEGEFYRVGGFY